MSTRRTPRVRLDDPDDDRGDDGVDGRTIPTGTNGNALLRAGEGRPAGRQNAVTQQVALGLRNGQSLTTGQVKRGLLEVVEFLGFYQKPSEAEITAFLGEGGGGLKGFLLQTALTRRRSFEKWFEKATIPQKIQAELDSDSMLARMLAAAAAARAALNGNGGNVIDVTPTRRFAFDDDDR